MTCADSQLHYQFDVRLPYREPSALYDGAVKAVWNAKALHHAVTGLDGAGYLHLEGIPVGGMQVELGPDVRRYLRKNNSHNQQFIGSSLSESDIDMLIVKHSGGVE